MSYEEYIQSDVWAENKQERLDFAMYRCELCGSQEEVHVHHSSYQNIGEEKIHDMIVLCETCHEIFHRRLGLHEAESDRFKTIEAPMDGELEETIEDWEKVYQEGQIHGISSGFPQLDRVTAGFQQGTVSVVAGRPGMGTTSFVLNLARNAAKHQDQSTGVLIVSTDLGERQIAGQLLTIEARVDLNTARLGRLKEDDWPRVVGNAAAMSDLPIHLHTAPDLTVSKIRNEIRAQCRSFGVGLLVIDSLQAIRAPDQSNQWREAQVNAIMRALKSLALKQDIAILLTSRVEKSVLKRGGDRRPKLSDLGQDSIVSEADKIIFLHRAERYGIQVDEHGNSTEGIAELIIAKQRNGPIGTVRLSFVKQYSRFQSLSYRADPNHAATSGDPDDNPPF